MSNKLKEAIKFVENLKESVISYELSDEEFSDNLCLGLDQIAIKLNSLLQESNEESKTCWSDKKVLTEDQKQELILTMNESEFNELYCCNHEPEQQEKVKEDVLEVVEYENGRELKTVCKNITTESGIHNVKVGSSYCLGNTRYDCCEHFKGHHVAEKSIRCSAKKAGG